MKIDSKPLRYAHAEGHTDVCYTEDGQLVLYSQCFSFNSWEINQVIFSAYTRMFLIIFMKYMLSVQ